MSLLDVVESEPEQEVPFARKWIMDNLRTLAKQVSRLPEPDQKDFSELFDELLRADSEEEMKDIALTLAEILSPPAGPVSEMSKCGPKNRPENLRKWVEFVGGKIREYRKAKNLTQEQLAERSGLPQSHICRIENGEHSPTRITLEKIAKGLDISIGDLDPSAP